MPPACDYLLQFQPIYRRYLWGGRRLATMLGRPLPPGDDYAESWEIVDHGEDQSAVAAGPLAGTTLGDLVAWRGAELLGRHAPQPRFPLLLKLLDCNRTLSVQVHPNDEQASRLDPPDLGKTEAWVVLAADPGSKIYAGLHDGVTRDDLVAAIEAGRCEELLHQFEPQAGDCVFIPAGTVHALGAGLVIAEIQQASDTTFRLFDWNRVDASGKPRPLHVEQSLEVIDFQRGPVSAVRPQPTAEPNRQRLVASDKFVLDRVEVDAPQSLGGGDQCHVLVCVEGAVDVGADAQLATAGTGLLPAAAGAVPIEPRSRAVLLDICLP